jgi:uncharacterized membrane protein YqiK
VIVGDAKCVYWCCESYKKLPLELMKLEVLSQDAETIKGVQVTATGIAQVKVLGNVIEWKVPTTVIAQPGVEPGAEPKKEWVLSPETDDDRILLAAQHFLGKSKSEVQASISATMEGHQRAIIGMLTPVQLFKDRIGFTRTVREHIDRDLMAMGMYCVSYTVMLHPGSGYMKVCVYACARNMYCVSD